MRGHVSTVAARSAQAFCDRRPPPRLFHHRLRTRVLVTTADAARIVDGDPGDLVTHATAAKTVQTSPSPGNNLPFRRLRSSQQSLCRAASHSSPPPPPHRAIDFPPKCLALGSCSRGLITSTARAPAQRPPHPPLPPPIRLPRNRPHIPLRDRIPSPLRRRQKQQRFLNVGSRTTATP